MDSNTFLGALRLDRLQIKEDINLLDIFGKTFIIYVTINNQHDIATNLLQKGAGPFLKDPYGNSAFFLAISECKEEPDKTFLLYTNYI